MKKLFTAVFAATALSACGVAGALNDLGNAIENTAKASDATMALEQVLPELTGKVMESIAAGTTDATFTENGTITISGATTDATEINVTWADYQTGLSGQVSGSMKLSGTVNFPNAQTGAVEAAALTATFTAGISLETSSNTHEISLDLEVGNNQVTYEGTLYEIEVGSTLTIKWTVDEGNDEFDPTNIESATSCTVADISACSDFAAAATCEEGETESTEYSCAEVNHAATATGYCELDGQVVTYYGEDTTANQTLCESQTGTYHAAE